MSCFNTRNSPPPSPPSSRQRGKRSPNISASLGRTTSSLPSEDLSSGNRRLICIRRQLDPSPIRLCAGFKSRTGWTSMSAVRRNQDSLVVLLPLPDPAAHCAMFAVFDGHGLAGHRVSALAAQQVAMQFTRFMGDGKYNVAGALRMACMRADKKLLTQKEFDISMTGTTASIAILVGKRLVCANVGDSRIVLATSRKGKVVPVPLTHDHVPDDPGEKARIEKQGGRVDQWAPNGMDTGGMRVWLKDRRVPGLRMSRVMGDSIVKDIVTSEPEITSHELSKNDRFVVVATDGVWGVMSNQEVVDFVMSTSPGSPIQKITEALVKHCARLWVDVEDGSIDDISAVIIRLHW